MNNVERETQISIGEAMWKVTHNKKARNKYSGGSSDANTSPWLL